MHGLWTTSKQYSSEECNALCRDDRHAMLVWTNTDIPESEDILAGWNPEVVILSVDDAPEAQLPAGELGAALLYLEARPMLVRFRVVMATPEAA